MSDARAWDPFVRTIHWSVAALVIIELLNEAGANPWHRYLGYAAAVLVVARLAWGLGNVGSARLGTMAVTASAAPGYLKMLLGGGSVALPAGHTPPGALMAFLLWGLLLVVSVTGWMHGLDAFWGEEWLQQLHAWLAYVLGGCAAVHVAAALVTSRLHRANLVKGMITGERTPSTDR
jgi:cytochrome b